MSGIEWTEQTWNPVTGCTKLSPGCKFCYAEVMAETPRHTYQILTKRARLMLLRMVGMIERHGILDNVWLGVSVENQRAADERIPYLIETPAALRFLSVEPLLGEVDLRGWLNEIDWVIVGGESGPNSRPIKAEWVKLLRDQCQAHEVPFFFKQWGGRNKKAAGRLLDGREWMEMPEGVNSEK